jgi:predicted type IV restriction endonuclease
MEQIENNLQKVLENTLKCVNDYRHHYLSNEQAVRSQLIEPILNSLGWFISNPKFVRPNAPNEEGKIPDYTLLKEDKNKLVVEAKNLSVELIDNKIINQISSYCYTPGIKFGILTNGVKWLLFNTFEQKPDERIVWLVDLENDNIEKVIRALTAFSFENIDELETQILTDKVLEKIWKSLIGSTKDDVNCNIINIISQKFLEKIRLSNPNINISQNQIFSYTKNKLIDYFKITMPVIVPISDPEPSPPPLPTHPGREKICVIFPDGTQIKHNIVAKTFVDSINKIGVEKVKNLNIIQSDVPLISEKKHEKLQQHRLGNYWIFVNTSTPLKVQTLREINQMLNVGLTIKSFYK